MSHASNTSKDSRHLVLVAYGTWGHTKPLCSLAARLVKTRPVYVTLFTTSPFYDRAEEEVGLSFNEREADTRARLRLVALETNGEGLVGMESLHTAFEKAYQALVKEYPLTCAKTGKDIGAISSPDVAIFDIFGSSMLTTVRRLSVKPVKVYGWIVTSTVSYHSYIGIASPNKNKDIRTRIHEEVNRSGRHIAEIAEEAFVSPKGHVLSIPGVPPIFDYEEYPQKEIVPTSSVGLFRLSCAEFTDNCDGLIVATPRCFEPPESLKAMLEYHEGEVHVVGPMLPVATNTHLVGERPSEKNQEFEGFITRALETHGPRSLVYISFGSLWWSTEPEKIWAFVDTLVARKVPFIFSHASPFAQIPDDVRAKVENSGVGLFSSWSPQDYILSHPVTGWFVTHCGFNSIMESIAAGVPMICWPYHADQPVNAIHLSENLGIAYELFEVRTGHGLKQINRTGKTPIGTLDAIRREANQILDQAFGEDGKEKQTKVKKLQEGFAQAWAEKGPSQLALERFLDNLTL